MKHSKEKSERKNFVYDNPSDLYNSLLDDYEQQYSNFLDEKKANKRFKHNFSDFLIIMNIKTILMKNQKPLKKN